MTNSDSIDELYLKALDLSGPKRRAFLRTLPAQTRAKVTVLLAADESVEKKKFLEDGFHEKAPKKNRKASGQRPVPSPTSRRKPLPDQVEAKKGLRSRKSKARTSRSVASPSGESSKRQRQSRKKKQAKRDRAARQKAPLLAGGAAVLMCSTLVWLIIGALQQATTIDATVAHGPPSTTQPLPEIEEDFISTQEKVPDSTPTANAVEPSGPPQFYTPAVSAPPLTMQQLTTLPKALHDASPVGNPLALPGVRAWSLETKGPRGRSTGLALTTDGRRAAVAGGDGCIRILDVGTGDFNRLIAFADAEKALSSLGQTELLHWRPGGDSLFALKSGNLLSVDMHTGITEHLVEGVGGFNVSSDEKLMYIFRRDTLLVCTTDEFSIAEELPVASGFRWIHVSPQNKYLLAAGNNRIALYENVRPLRLILEDSRNSRCGNAVVNDKGIVVAGWNDGFIRVYDPSKSTEQAVTEFDAYPSGARWADCRAWWNEDTVLCTGWGATLDHFSISKNAFIARHEVPLFGGPLVYRKDIEAGLMGSAALWHLRNGTPEKELLRGDESNMDSLTFSRDGTELFLSGNQTYRFNLTTGLKSPLTQSKDRLNLFSIKMNDDGLLVGQTHGGLRAFYSDPPSIKSSVKYKHDAAADAPGVAVKHFVWAEGGRSVLVQAADGKVNRWRIDTNDTAPIAVPGGEKVLDMVWDSMNSRALLLSESRLLSWDSLTGLVAEVGEVPADSRAISLNSAGTFLAIVAPKTSLMETTGFTTVAEFDWHSGHHFWAANDELLCLADGGRTMYKVDPAVTDSASKVPVPLAGFGGRRFAISPTGPVAAAITAGNQIRFIDTRNGAHLGTLLPFRDDHVLLTPEGRIVGMSPGMQDQIIYQVLTDEGQETLTSSEFHRRYRKYLTP